MYVVYEPVNKIGSPFFSEISVFCIWVQFGILYCSSCVCAYGLLYQDPGAQ